MFLGESQNKCTLDHYELRAAPVMLRHCPAECLLEGSKPLQQRMRNYLMGRLIRGAVCGCHTGLLLLRSTTIPLGARFMEETLIS